MYSDQCAICFIQLPNISVIVRWRSTRGYSFLEATELITSFISSYLTRTYIYIACIYIYIHILINITIPKSLYILIFI